MVTRTEKLTVIDQDWLEKNKKQSSSLYSDLENYADKTAGTYRLTQLLQKGLKLANALTEQMGGKVSRTLSSLQENLRTGASAMAVVTLPGMTSSAIRSVSAVHRQEDDGVPFYRKAVKAVRDVADAVASYGYSLLFVRGVNPAVVAVSQSADFTSDVLDLQLSVQDYQKATELHQVASGEAKEALTHSKNYYFLRVAKAVATVAATVFGLFLLGTGWTVVALLALCVATTALSIVRDLYKNRGTYPVIDFDREVILQLT